MTPLRSEPCACGDAIDTWDVTGPGITRAVDLHNRSESHRAWRNARELDLLTDAETFGRVSLSTTTEYRGVDLSGAGYGASSSSDRARRLHRR